MTRRLVASYLTLTVLVLAGLVLPLGLTFADHEVDALLSVVERDAVSVSAAVEDDLETGAQPQVAGLLAGYARGGGRVVVVDTRGVSVADSAGDPGRDFTDRPEIAAALRGELATGARGSQADDLIFVAVPVTSGGQIHGAVRVSYPMSELDERVRENWVRLGFISLLVLAAVALLGTALARQVTRPVRRLEDAARQLAAGRLGARVPVDTGPPELRSLGRTFNHTADRLERLLTAQQQFVADAAHQLRTPLTALQLRLENLARYLPADQEPKLRATVAETERLGRLVESLLALARADAAGVGPVPVDVAAVIHERVEAWASVASREGIRLVVEEPGPPPTALVLPGALDQILDNLLANAIAASPAAGRIVIAVGDDPPDGVAVSVTDEGPGLPAEQLAHAFDRFWQAPDRIGGSGLGLAVVRRLVEAAGGSAVLEQGPGGRGLRAVVHLRSARELEPLPAPNPARTRHLPSRS